MQRGGGGTGGRERSRSGGGGGLMHVVGRAMEGVEVEVDGDEERGGDVVGEVLIGGVQVVQKN